LSLAMVVFVMGLGILIMSIIPFIQFKIEMYLENKDDESLIENRRTSI